jgi:hypothetical protein
VLFYFQDQNIWWCKHVEERVGRHGSKKEQAVAQRACAHVLGPGAIDRTEATMRAPVILTRPCARPPPFISPLSPPPTMSDSNQLPLASAAPPMVLTAPAADPHCASR